MSKAPKFFEAHMCQYYAILAKDKVANVRIMLARALRDHCQQFESGSVATNFITNPIVKQVIAILKQDTCRDVIDLISRVQQSFLPDASSDSEESLNLGTPQELESEHEETKEELEWVQFEKVIQAEKKVIIRSSRLKNQTETNSSSP